jgi:hypothetical protein
MTRYLLPALPLFLFCSSSLINKNPENSYISSATLLLAPVATATIALPANNETVFGKGNKDTIILKHILDYISQGMRSKGIFKNVELCDSARSLTLLDGITSSPGNNTNKITFNCKADVALFLYNMYIDSTTKDNFYQDPRISMTSLNFSCDYLYWDINGSSILSTGKIAAGCSNLFPSISKKDWDALLDKVIKKLVSKQRFIK